MQPEEVLQHAELLLGPVFDRPLGEVGLHRPAGLGRLAAFGAEVLPAVLGVVLAALGDVAGGPARRAGDSAPPPRAKAGRGSAPRGSRPGVRPLGGRDGHLEDASGRSSSSRSACRPSLRSSVAVSPSRMGAADMRAASRRSGPGRWWHSSKTTSPKRLPSFSMWMQADVVGGDRHGPHAEDVVADDAGVVAQPFEDPPVPLVHQVANRRRRPACGGRPGHDRQGHLGLAGPGGHHDQPAARRPSRRRRPPAAPGARRADWTRGQRRPPTRARGRRRRPAAALGSRSARSAYAIASHRHAPTRRSQTQPALPNTSAIRWRVTPLSKAFPRRTSGSARRLASPLCRCGIRFLDVLVVLQVLFAVAGRAGDTPSSSGSPCRGG